MGFEITNSIIGGIKCRMVIPGNREAKQAMSKFLNDIIDGLNELADEGIQVNSEDFNEIMKDIKKFSSRGRKPGQKNTKKAAKDTNGEKTPANSGDEDLPPGFVEDDGPEPPAADA
jgi:hypothetical protein